MGISESELAIQRSLTKEFVQADNLEVVLYRRSGSGDGAGGTVYGPPVPLAPQVMRLIPQQSGVPERLTANGVAVTPSYALLGTYEADMERGDTFTLDTGRYEVVFVNANRQYEVKGEVAYLGR